MGDAVNIGPACRSFDGDWVNCETCEKWRKLPAIVFNALEENVKWSCEMNSYTGFNKCSIPQECSDKSIDAQRREATKKAEKAAARAAGDDGVLPIPNPTTTHGSHKGAAKTPAASVAAGKQTTVVATPKTTPAAVKKAAATPKAHAQATPSSTAATVETCHTADAPVDGQVGTSSKGATATPSQLKVFSSARRKLSESSSTLPATAHPSDPAAQPSCVPATALPLLTPKPSAQAPSKLSTNSTTQRKPRKSTEQASLSDAQPDKPAANVTLPHTALSLPETSILDAAHPSSQPDKFQLKATPQASTGAVDQDPAQPPLKKKKVVTQATQQTSLSAPASGIATPPAIFKGEASAGASGLSVTLASEDTLSAALSAVLDAVAGPSATPQWETLISSLAESLLSTSNQAKMAPVIHTGKLDGIDFKIVPKKADTDASLVCQGRFGHGQFWCLVDGVAHGVSRPVDVCKLYSTRLLASDNLVNRIELVRYTKRLGLLVTAVGERLTGKEGPGVLTVDGVEEEGQEGEAGTGAHGAEVISLDDNAIAPPVQVTELVANPQLPTSALTVTAAATSSDAAAAPVPAASRKSVNQKPTAKLITTSATPKQSLATPPTAKPRAVGSRSSGRHTSGTSADLADTSKVPLEPSVSVLSTDAAPVVQGPQDSTATLEAVQLAATTALEVGAAASTSESGQAVPVTAPCGATLVEATDTQAPAVAEATRATEAAAATVVSAVLEAAAAEATPPLPSPFPVPQAAAMLTPIMVSAVDTSAPTAPQIENTHASAALDPVVSTTAACVIEASTSNPEASATMLDESTAHATRMTLETASDSVAAEAGTPAAAAGIPAAAAAAATEEPVEAATAIITQGPAEQAPTAMETDEPSEVAGASKQVAAKKGGGGRWPKAVDGTSQAAMNKAHAGLKNATGTKPAGVLKLDSSVGEVSTAVVADALAADIQPEASTVSGQFDDALTPLPTELPKLSLPTQVPSSHVPKPLAAKGRAPKQQLQQPHPSPPLPPASHSGTPTSHPASLPALPLAPISLPLLTPTSTQRATQKRKPNTPHPAAPPATAARPSPSSKAAPSPSSSTLQHPVAPFTQQTAQLSIINAAAADLQPLQQMQPAMAADGAPERRCFLELGKAVLQGPVLVTITDLFTCLRPPLPDVVALHLLSGQALRPELLHVTTANAGVVADVQRMLAYVSGTGIPVEEWGVARQQRRESSLNGTPAYSADVHAGAAVAEEDEQGEQPKRRRMEEGGREVRDQVAGSLLATSPPSPADDALMLSGIAAYVLTGWAEIRNEPGVTATTAVPLSLPAPEPVPVTTEAVLPLAEAADPMQPGDDQSLSAATIAISAVVNEAGAAAVAPNQQEQAPQPVAAKLQTLKHLSTAVTSLASSDSQANSAAETMSRTLLEFGITSEDVTVLCERLVDARKAKQSSVARHTAI